MIRKVFSVYDTKAGAYMTPFFYPSEAMAIRAFTQAVLSPEHDIHAFPQDYTLFAIGEFDDEKGWIEPHAPRSLGNGVEFKGGDAWAQERNQDTAKLVKEQ